MKRKPFYLIFIFMFFVSCRQENFISNFDILSIEETKISNKIRKYNIILETNTLFEIADYNWIITNEESFSNIKYESNGSILVLEGDEIHFDEIEIEVDVYLTNKRKLRAVFKKEIGTPPVLEGSWIKDSILRDAIKSKLKETGVNSIEKNDVEKLDGLDASNLGIETLEGLENLTFLSGNWDLSGNNIQKIDSLENLVINGELNLNANPLFPIEATKLIDGLDNVIEIIIENQLSSDNYRLLGTIKGTVSTQDSFRIEKSNNINIVNPEDNTVKDLINDAVGRANLIEGYAKLKDVNSIDKLDLIDSSIKNLKGLEKVNGIRSLHIMSSNNIENFNLIFNITSLEELTIGSNEVFNQSEFPLQNIEGIKNLTNLKVLTIGKTLIENFDEISNLSTLRELTVLKTGISSLNFLSNLSELNSVQFISVDLSKTSSLGSSSSITFFNFLGSKITDLNFLSNYPAVTSLALEYSEINNIDGLLNRGHLISLSSNFDKYGFERYNSLIQEKIDNGSLTIDTWTKK